MSRFGGYEDQPFLAELYDSVPGYSGRRDLEFYVNLCRLANGKVLELGCGTGRVLIPAAVAGTDIVGLDLSPYMLAKCKEKLSAQPEAVRSRVRVLQGDMTDFHLEDRFSQVIIPFRPFQHLVDLEDQLGCLRCANAHLNMGGRIAFDLFQVNFRKIADPGGMEEQEDLPEFELPDGRKLRRCNRITATHRSEQYNDVELIYYLTGTDGMVQRLVQTFPFRYFFRYEVEHLLARCGFSILELHGDFDGLPLEENSPEMIFIAEKIENVVQDGK